MRVQVTQQERNETLEQPQILQSLQARETQALHDQRARALSEASETLHTHGERLNYMILERFNANFSGQRERFNAMLQEVTAELNFDSADAIQAYSARLAQFYREEFTDLLGLF